MWGYLQQPVPLQSTRRPLHSPCPISISAKTVSHLQILLVCLTHILPPDEACSNDGTLPRVHVYTQKQALKSRRVVLSSWPALHWLLRNQDYVKEKRYRCNLLYMWRSILIRFGTRKTVRLRMHAKIVEQAAYLRIQLAHKSEHFGKLGIGLVMMWS